MELKDIQQILPHRYPFLLIDRAIEVQTGKSAKAIAQVSGNQWFFQGHFPNHPVMPGVLIIEALAQTGALALLSESENGGKIAFLAGIDKARFHQQVLPGDSLELSVEIIKRRANIGKGQAIATVNGKKVASCELLFAIES